MEKGARRGAAKVSQDEVQNPLKNRKSAREAQKFERCKVKPKTLVTGGSGFIGTYIIDHLIDAGYEVVSFDLYRPAPATPTGWLVKEKEKQLTFVRGDITDFYGLLRVAKEHNVDAIVHAGALTDVDLLKESPTLALRINTGGTVNALEAARILKMTRVVILSSIAVYAPKQYEPMDEEHPVHLPNQGPALASYSCSKLAGEAFGLHYWAEFGVPFMAIRCSGVYGFGMKYPMYIKTMLENALEKKPTTFETGGDVSRDFVYVKDVALAVSLALQSKEERLQNRIFNIAHGGPLTKGFQLAEVVKEFIPEAEIHIGRGLSEYEAKIERSRGKLSIQKAQTELGYEPHFDLRKGIQDYIELFRAYQKDLSA
jgi:UDP-glucose 4-epimerase